MPKAFLGTLFSSFWNTKAGMAILHGLRGWVGEGEKKTKGKRQKAKDKLYLGGGD
jgi:hypothetical protein